MDMTDTEACYSDSESLEFFFDSEIDNDDVDDSAPGGTKRISARNRIEVFTTPEKKVRQVVAMRGMKLFRRRGEMAGGSQATDGIRAEQEGQRGSGDSPTREKPKTQ
ncbi:unnamed protein product [Candidula unifasciata]|uniref:Uncharacterized protein n=1 Tax=Candidula unifasciata TaxID=100452 RepID=A0A8S3ZG15_9EUPU|nr:unnamed protein product [Candidula unifasciata]